MTKTNWLRVLVVEDHEHRVERFKAWSPADVRLVWAKSAGIAIGMLRRDRGRIYDGIMLDHDLADQGIVEADRHFSGQHVVKQLIQLVDNDVPVFVHSTNISGGPEMARLLRGAGFDVVQVPMGDVTAEKYRRWLDDVRAAREEADE